jgi:hypothetical protein
MPPRRKTERVAPKTMMASVGIWRLGSEENSLKLIVSPHGSCPKRAIFDKWVRKVKYRVSDWNLSILLSS